MIRDFNEGEDSASLSADICIVGCGAAGVALARDFNGSGFKVIVLESGGESRETDTDDLYRSVVDGRAHSGVHTGRARVFGGTTTLWGGQALPLLPLDLQCRNWVPESGWPIAYSELSQYYPQVLRLLKLSETDFSGQPPQLKTAPVPNFSPELLQLVYSQWSPSPNFASAYRRELATSTNVEVRLHTNVTELSISSKNELVSHAEVRSLNGRRGRVFAKFFVVCCGGIETARLLLASRSRYPNGIGNAHDLVGRFFQDHIAIRCGIIRPHNRAAFNDIFDQFLDRGVKFYPKLIATETLQRSEKILSVIGNCYTVIDPNSGISLAKSIAKDAKAGRWDKVKFTNIIGGLGAGTEILPAAWRLLAKKRIYSSPSGIMYLEAHVEQEPNPESRVLLSPDYVDFLGMPRTVVRWRPSFASARSARVFADVVAKEFFRLGLADVELNLPSDNNDFSSWDDISTDLNHHMGTARMSPSATTGVTDRHCRIHGLSNLYIASSAVFPTSGSSNPTFTLLALTYRIADDLRRLLRKYEISS